MSVRRPLVRGAALTGLAGVASLAWAAGVERRWYTLRHAVVPVLRDPAARPLRILHLTDLHQLPGQQHRLDFVEACARTGPDLVVVTGDLLEADEAIDDVVASLSSALRGRPGVAVLGAHDYWGPRFKQPWLYLTAPAHRRYGRRLDTARLVSGLEAGGYQVVDDRRAGVKTPSGFVDIAGLGDPHVGYDRPERVDWSKPDQDVVLRLGLVHAPYQRSLERFDRTGFDLVLAGHTHGGQVRVPFVGALTNNTDLPLRHSRGLFRYGCDLWVHVSAGLGHSRYAPIRFCCRPEATLLDLVPAPAGPGGGAF